MSKTQGELTELRFYLIAYSRGWIISKPFGDNAKYDFVVDVGGKLSRIQVKSTSIMDHTNRQDRYAVLAASGNKVKKVYTKNEIDFLAMYIIPEDVWYIIPVEKLDGRMKLHFRPFDSASKGKHESFKMAWDLLE